jgi:LPXTG-site transpeptidase (sortase) family protein
MSNYLDYVSINPGSLSMSPGSVYNRTRVWRILSPSSLSPGSKITFWIKARVSPNVTTPTVRNTITVSGISSSRTTSATTYDENTITEGLEIYKTVSPSGMVLVGQPIKYTITVKNTGATVSYVNVQDVLASTLDILSPIPQGSSYNSSSRTFSYYQSSLAKNASLTLQINARPNNTVTTNRTIYNTATVTWGSPSQSGTSNQVSNDVTPAGAISLDKYLYSNLSTIYPGDTISYTIVISNVGSLPISSIVLNDTLDSYFEYQSIYPGSLNMSGSCSNTHHFCSWTFNSPSSLSPNQKISFTIKGQVSNNIPLGHILKNVLSATAVDSYRSLSGSDTFTRTITSPPEAPKMQIKLDLDPLQAKIGDSLTADISVKNTGDIEASQVYANMQFPDLLDITSATTTRGSITTNSSARTVLVNIGTLAAGHTTYITIVVKVNTTAVINKTHPVYATVYWYKDHDLDSKVIRFRILPGSTLPGTGMLSSHSGYRAILGKKSGFERESRLARLPDFTWLDGNTRAESDKTISPISFILGAVCSTLSLMGLVLLIYGFWARMRRPLYAGWYTRIGVILMLSGVLFGLAGLGLNRSPPATSTPQLAELVGTKPVYPTREPTQIPPTLAPTATFWRPPTATSTPLTLPDYPIPAPTGLPTVGLDGGSPDSSDVMRIKIPAMGLDTVVKFVPFNGDTWLIGGLKQEVAWMGDTSWPGLGGNTGLAGHIDLVDGSKGPFWNLKDLKSGDEVFLYTQEKIYVYKVRNQEVVEDSDMSVIDPTEKPQVTLITCTDWDPELRTYLKRLIVYADLSEVKTPAGS